MDIGSPRNIRSLASGLLKQATVESPPIPIERIAKLKGATIRYVPFEGRISGLLYQDEDQTIIGVNKLHPKTRQRFTIAHELGHLLLHSDEELYLDRDFRIALRNEHSSESTDINEIQANSFAAELLMPFAMLRGDLRGHVLDYENDDEIRTLANRYKVSLQAMIFRLTNLGLITRLDYLDI